MRPRVLYFFFFAWTAFSGGRFIAPFLENVAHFSDTLNGIALALQTGLVVIIGPCAGLIADKFEKKYPRSQWGRGFVLCIGVSVATVAVLMHGVVFSVFGSNNSWAVCCHLLIRVLYTLGKSVVIPVLDAMTLVFLEEEENGKGSNHYGKERMYGAIGWAIGSLAVAPFIDRWGYVVLLASAPIAAIICIITMYLYTESLAKIYDERERENNDNEKNATSMYTTEGAPCAASVECIETESSRSVALSDPDIIDRKSLWEQVKHVSSLLRIMCGTKYGLGFVLSSLTLSMGMSLVENLIFLFFEELGASASMCGATVFVTVLFELPIYHVAPTLLEMFGIRTLHPLACAAYIPRVVGYSFIPKDHAGFVLFLEPLHGVTYACQQTCSVAFVADVTPKGSEATGQGVLTAIVGFGSVFGLVVGGYLQDELGAKFMYRFFASVVTLGLCTFCFMTREHWELPYKFSSVTIMKEKGGEHGMYSEDSASLEMVRPRQKTKDDKSKDDQRTIGIF